MRTLCGRERLLAALALGWLVVAGAAAAWDWPTPRRRSEERLQLAYLVANVVDKDFRPYDQPPAVDPDVQYQQLVADFRDRFGQRFDIAFVANHHDDALAGMARERVRIVVFALASTAVVWWLLFTIGRLFGPRENTPAGPREDIRC